MTVTLDPHDADDLAGLLGLLEDWLLHASDEIRQDLALFGFRAHLNPDLEVDWLIEHLGHASVSCAANPDNALPGRVARRS